MTELQRKNKLFCIIGISSVNEKRNFNNWLRGDNSIVLQKLAKFALVSIECNETIDSIDSLKKSFDEIKDG